jgi:hypothetical protein
MAPEHDSALFEEIDLGRDFPDIDDVEGYVEQLDYYDRAKTVRTYFYRLGNTMSETFVSCADVDCEGVYYVRDLIALAYVSGKKHLENTLPCCAKRSSPSTSSIKCLHRGRKKEIPYRPPRTVLTYIKSFIGVEVFTRVHHI